MRRIAYLATATLCALSVAVLAGCGSRQVVVEQPEMTPEQQQMHDFQQQMFQRQIEQSQQQAAQQLQQQQQ